MAGVAELYQNIKSWAASQWPASYFRIRAKAQNVAENMLLVHVTGKAGRPPFEELISNPPRVLKTSACSWCEPDGLPKKKGCRRCQSDKTRAAENRLELGRNVYFFAGRANAEFGSVALAFGPSEAGHTGGGIFLDTGGLACGKVKTSLSATDDETLRAFVRQHELPLKRWRSGLRKHLAENFDRISDYFDGTPNNPGPADLFDKNPDWRAWVYEVRAHEPRSILQAVAWCASPDQVQNVRQALAQVDSFDAQFDDLILFMDNLINPEGEDESCERLEQWVRGELEPWLR